MNKATIRSSFLHTSDIEGEFLQIIHKLDTLFVSTTLGDNHSFPLCINSFFTVCVFDCNTYFLRIALHTDFEGNSASIKKVRM